MTSPACRLCGYAVTDRGDCPTCGGRSSAPDLGSSLAGNVGGVGLALAAIPRGLALLARTPGTKRWLLPPLLLTLGAIVLFLVWALRFIERLAERARPQDLQLPTWDWIESLPAGWRWLTAVWHAMSGALEWVLGGLASFLLAQPFQLLTLFLVGSLAVWYGASIVYEALAGPFLDEIQARVEARWFGEDPRSRLDRPVDLPPDEAMRWTGLAAGLGAGLSLAAFLALDWGLLPAGATAPLGLLVPLALERRYAPWLRWFLRVELRAFVAGVQGALLSLAILILALPLYFVPVAGYFLYAAATGVATATSLLDIPLERRGWPFRARLRLLRRFPLVWITFGVVAGLLLAVPLIGPLLFVPTTSLGGLWLLCRLDKTGLVRSEVPCEVAPGERSA